MLPQYTGASKNPITEFLRPIVISFEKIDGKIAVFNLTEEQLYNTIASTRLIQTFTIAEENNSEIIINFDKGFLSLPTGGSEGAPSKFTLKKLSEDASSKKDNFFDIKDSIVKDLEIKNNSIVFNQVIRRRQQGGILSESFEENATIGFEIRPYVQNTNFKAQIYDKSNTVGYFLNFSSKENQDEVIPQVMKWYIDPNATPIQVQLQDNTPSELKETIIEGAQYWNKVFGFEALTVKGTFKSTDSQQDRTIRIYWLNWDSAGFAQAGIQADPITGEILRGNVMLTSSWLLIAKNKFSFQIKSNNGNAAKTKFSVCNLDQAETLTEISKLFTIKASIEKKSKDVIRSVVAHEVGHALGLRHNFAGSVDAALTDAEIKQEEKDYLNEVKNSYKPVATTVMDYLTVEHDGIIGRTLLTEALAYDVAAIKWAYSSGSLPESSKYCTDEHISFAVAKSRKVYGCQRGDRFKNPIDSALEKSLYKEKNKAQETFKSLVSLVKSSDVFFKRKLTIDEILQNINIAHISNSELNDFLYKDPSEIFYSFLFTKNWLLDFLNDEIVDSSED